MVQNLAKHGLLEVVGTTRKGARPERTIYRITSAGIEELLDWTRELLGVATIERPRFEAGLSVAMALPPDEVAALLTRRLEQLEQAATRQRAALGELGERLPRIMLIENEYAVAMLGAEITWMRSVLEELTNGTFPGLKTWQGWHDTGEFPAPEQ